MLSPKWLSGLLLIAAVGCSEFDVRHPFSTFRSQAPDTDEASPDEDDEFTTEVDTPMIGEYISVGGLNLIRLEGVGLVTCLDGTGGDPPPSSYRTALLEEMKRRDVKDPNARLRSPNTALVIVRAYLPPLIQEGETFDVEVRLPGNSEATSLHGGWLMETALMEQAVIPGRGVLSGHKYAEAEGPILLSTGVGDKASLAGVLRRGKVLGGAVATAKATRHLALFLRNDFRSVRNASRIADRIGERFYHYNSAGLREPLAEAKTDIRVELKVAPQYKENYPRYLQVIRKIAFRETQIAQRVRMQKLEQQLMNPATCEKAALALEAIGNDAVPILKSGLKSKYLEVRFQSGVALAYLGEPDGLAALHEAARDEPAFRIFAFAAMAAIEDAESHVLLRDLLNAESTETRYGAFRALTTLDKNDPFIRGEHLNGEFMLHVLNTEGSPLVHLTNHRKSEIVLFGADQHLRTPLAVRAGPRILVTAPAGSDTVVVSRYEVGKPDMREEVSTNIAHVIRKVCEFGATYPDVAGMLAQADSQNNMPGAIAIDALPRAGRVYQRPDVSGEGGTRARIGRNSMAPNLFLGDEPPPERASSSNREEKVEEEPEPENEEPEAGEETLETNPIQLTSGTGAEPADATGKASAADLRTAEPDEEQPSVGDRLLRFFKRPSKLDGQEEPAGLSEEPDSKKETPDE